VGFHLFRRLSLAVHPSQPKLVMAQPEKEKAMTTDIVQQIRKATRRRFTAPPRTSPVRLSPRQTVKDAHTPVRNRNRVVSLNKTCEIRTLSQESQPGLYLARARGSVSNGHRSGSSARISRVPVVLLPPQFEVGLIQIVTHFGKLAVASV
jgi:hypothetical protein